MKESGFFVTWQLSNGKFIAWKCRPRFEPEMNRWRFGYDRSFSAKGRTEAEISVKCGIADLRLSVYRMKLPILSAETGRILMSSLERLS